MLYTESYSSLRKNGINGARRDYAISIACQDTRQPPINRKRERDSKRNITLVPQHEY
jgi:hypothetical protein